MMYCDLGHHRTCLLADSLLGSSKRARILMAGSGIESLPVDVCAHDVGR